MIAVGAAVVLAPATASAQQTTPCDQETYTYSKISKPAQYDALPQQVVDLTSNYDGAAIQVGLIRPDVPAGVKVPVIVQASPYFNPLQTMDLTACSPRYVANFVAQGYAVALVPVRGTADNGGCMDMMGPGERADLDQVVTWLGTQDWSSGSVGLVGKSYDGSTPWEAASFGNPHLKTIVPIEGVNDLFKLLFGPGTPDWRGPLVLNDIYYAQSIVFYANGRTPTSTVGQTACPDYAVGSAATVYSTQTGQFDPAGYWAARRYRNAVERNYHGSIFLVQGLQDWNVNPAEQFPWVTQLQAGGLEVKYMIGQWGHNNPDDASGAAKRNDWADILLAWFDRYLKGEKVPFGPNVQVESSDGKWRNAAIWPPRHNDYRLFLTSDGKLSRTATDATSTPLLTPDPAHTQGAAETISAPAPLDTTCPASNCVAFATTPFTSDFRLAGLPRLHLSVTPTATNGELSAYLYSTDGTKTTRIGWGQVDLRYPNGGDGGDQQPATVTPGAAATVDFPLQPLDTIVPAGQRLVLVLSEGTTYNRLPSVPNGPMQLALGGTSATLSLAAVHPQDGDFFTPPK